MDYLAIVNSKEEFLLQVEALIRLNSNIQKSQIKILVFINKQLKLYREDQANEKIDRHAAVTIQKNLRASRVRRQLNLERYSSVIYVNFIIIVSH